MQLIVSSATGVIEQRKVILPEKKLSLSVLEIFENAIGDIVSKISLFIWPCSVDISTISNTFIGRRRVKSFFEIQGNP